MRRRLGVALVLGLCVAGPMAIAGTGDKPVTWQFDLGYSTVQGDPGKIVNNGYTLGFGAVVRPNPKRPVAWRFEMTYDWWDANTTDFPDLGVRIDDGNVDQWALRAGYQYESHGDRVKFIGGVGIGGYRLHANLTQQVLIPGWICDPYWWWYCYPGLVPGDIILANKTLTKFGYYATAGISFPLKSSDIYVELQYHRVDVEEYFDTLPITVGWRW